MTANKRVRAAVVLAAGLLLGGCVTRSTYEELEAQKNREIAALQSEREVLQRQRAELEQQIERLEAERAALENQKVWLNQEQVALQTRIGLLAQEKGKLEEQQAALRKESAELREQVEALKQQKQELLASSQETESQYNALVRNLTEELQKGELQVRRYQNMLTVDVADQLFFASGEANLKASGKEVLKKLGDSLRAYEDKVIRVIGHTDNVPISKAARKIYPSNWELSVARATSVVRYLQQLGIQPERLVASGRAEYAPVATNDTPEGRRKNRRIEITLIDRNLMEQVSRTADAADTASGQ